MPKVLIADELSPRAVEIFRADIVRTLKLLGCSSIAALVLQAGAGIAASVALAWLSYECFEKHFLRLKRYWPSSHARILHS